MYDSIWRGGGMVFRHKDCMQTPKKYLYCFTMHLLIYCICTAVHKASCLRILFHELQSIIHSQLGHTTKIGVFCDNDL